MRLLIILLILFPVASWATNGEGCNTDITQYTSSAMGRMTPLGCVTVLDDISSASGGPVVFEYGYGVHDTTPYIKNDFRSLPDAVRIVVGTDNDCTDGDVTITTSDVKGGAEYDLAASAVVLDVDTTSPAGDTGVIINLQSVPTGKFLNFRWANGVCTNGFDILLIPYELAR